MKVKELIKRLQTLDQELDVYVYNEKEHELNLVETAKQTSDWGEGENGECDWEEFITIFTTKDPQPLFTLTAEEVERAIPIIVNGIFRLRGDYSYRIYHTDDWNKDMDFLYNLLTRIKLWQDENNRTD